MRCGFLLGMKYHHDKNKYETRRKSGVLKVERDTLKMSAHFMGDSVRGGVKFDLKEGDR